ncbi:hypothetical protein Ancab_003426 [Ancistrocladus abbreviatus]
MIPAQYISHWATWLQPTGHAFPSLFTVTFPSPNRNQVPSMSNSGDSRPFPAEHPPFAATSGDNSRHYPLHSGDPLVPIMNLSAVRTRMNSLQCFLTDSVNRQTVLAQDQMDVVSAELASAIQEVIVNAASLVACSQIPSLPFHTPNGTVDVKIFGDISHSSETSDCKILDTLKLEVVDEDMGDGDSKIDDYEVVELHAVELLAEHIHFCEICGKGFKRDANLRMHMRAHGDQFKTPEALAKPEKGPEQRLKPSLSKEARFSCPFVGCNRNKQHKKFRPLKSVICVKNHFKRSHWPKMYSCKSCNKKNFSVLADLKSHQKHCGESKWRCSCGTSFTRKDKLFGHLALFEGHAPAIVDDEKSKGLEMMAMMDEDESLESTVKNVAGSAPPLAVAECGNLDDGFFDGLPNWFY